MPLTKLGMKFNNKKKKASKPKEVLTENPMVALEYYQDVYEYKSEFDKEKLKYVEKRTRTREYAIKNFIFDIQETRIKNLSQFELLVNGELREATKIIFTDDTYLVSPYDLLMFIKLEFPTYLSKLNAYMPPMT
jgi:polynucleotide 5'-kinase involved in rRNA processing